MQTLHYDAPPPRGLTAADFTRIAANGFGDPQNAYCHCMAYFQDRVYVGTTRHSLALLKLFPPAEPPAMSPWPVPVPGRVQELDMRGQIWCYTPAEERWERAFDSPLMTGKDGVEQVPRDLGYRGMSVFQGRSDAAPALYVGTMSTVLRATAACILRSEDGVTFTPVSQPGLGDPNVSTFRSLLAFDGHLYVPPTGEGTQFNSNRRSVVMRSADPASGGWETACEPGFGDPSNQGVFELAVFDGHLYAGTFNNFHGYQLWKTPASGGGPCRWTKVLERGAHRGRRNEIAMSLCAFGDALYVGSAIQNGGYDRMNRVGPAAGEVVRVYPDDSWELLVGEPRTTPQGRKYPLSGMGPGFDNLFAGYIWRMAEHEGWLYTSTFDWSVFLPYAKRPSPAARNLVRRVGTERIVDHGGGFDLWRTRDGVEWVPVSRDGLRNPFNYGARTLVSTPHGLFVGTANPFGPEVATRLSSRWLYRPNPDGGAEVWVGRAAPSSGPEATVRVEHVADAAPPVLVTGATGFIGAHFLQRLLREGGRVRVLALESTLGALPPSDQVEVVTGSITDPGVLGPALEGVATVYHLAGMLPGSPHRELMSVNVQGTETLLRACARAGGVRRFVFLSSVAVYGGPFQRRKWPYSEKSPLLSGGSADLLRYGRSKADAEALVLRYAADAGFEYVILRPATCYGPGGKFLQDLVDRVLDDPTAGQRDRGGLAMQILHVRDLAVDMLPLAGTRPEAANEVFNVAGSEAPVFRHVARLIRRLAQRGDRRTLLPDASRDFLRFDLPYDISRAREVLGFIPRVTLEEGLAELVAARAGAAAPSAPARRERRGQRARAGA